MVSSKINKKSKISRRCHYCNWIGNRKDCKLKELVKEITITKDGAKFILMRSHGQTWDEVWYVNTGNKHQMAGNRCLLTKFREAFQVETRTAEHNIMIVQGVGEIKLEINNTSRIIHGVFFLFLLLIKMYQVWNNFYYKDMRSGLMVSSVI